MNEADFVALLVFIVPMCFTPGPNNLLCAAHGSQHGFRATIPLTLGMLVGWSSLGVAVGLGTVYIEENQEIFQALTWIGAAYIAYLGWNFATSNPKMQESEKTERLGFKTGLILQIVNGKAWIPFPCNDDELGTTVWKRRIGKDSASGNQCRHRLSSGTDLGSIWFGPQQNILFSRKG